MDYNDELNNLLATEPSSSEELLVNPILINVTSSSTTTQSSTSVSLNSLKFWSENRKICELFTQAIHDLTRDLDPFAVILIVVALVIAIVGAIAIVCQCQMWRKSKRQRHYDTSSWLEYSLDREKLTHNNNNHKLQRQLDNKKYISKLFQSSLLPPVPTPMPSGGSNLHKFAFNNSQLYLNASPSRHYAVDIDQCQLVQSFMKHENGKQNLDAKKKKNAKDAKVVKKGAKKNNKPESGNIKKVDNSKKRSKQLHSHKNLLSSDRLDTLPFFTNASISSSSKTSDQGEHNRSTSTGPTSLQKEYETQTLEMNLTGSEDGESQTNVSIDEKIYERIMQYPPRNTTTTVTASTSANKPSPPAQNQHKPIQPSKQPSPSGLVHSTPKQSNVPNASTTNRQRQQIPPSNIDIANRHNAKSLAKLASQYQHQQQHKSTAGTLAKNPLYSEIGEHEESIIFSDDSSSGMKYPSSSANKCTVGGFALENDSRAIYSQIQPPMMARQMTYSTFIKPPSPTLR